MLTRRDREPPLDAEIEPIGYNGGRDRRLGNDGLLALFLLALGYGVLMVHPVTP